MTARTICLFATLLTLSCLAPALRASTVTWPDLLNYQGQLTDPSGLAVADGSYTTVFKLNTVPSGATPALWTETQTVTTSKGLFNALLGSVTPLGGILLPNAGSDLWIGFKVGSDAEMTPRQQLVPAVYATQARNAATLGGMPPGTAAFNVVQLDASAKIPAGLVGSSSLSLPLSLSGSGGVYNLSVNNTSVAGSAIVAQANGTNFSSDASDRPTYGFFHNDLNPAPGAIGVYARSSCSDCSAGYFYNISATAGAGAALFVNGRLSLPVTSGTFTTGNNVSSFTITNSYIRTAANTTVVLIPMSNINPRWWLSSVGAVANQAVISFSSSVSAVSFQYVILAK